MIGERGIEGGWVLEVERGAVLQEQFDQWAGDIGVAGLFAGAQQPHCGPAIGPECRGIHVSAAVEQQPGDLDDVFGQRAKPPASRPRSGLPAT